REYQADEADCCSQCVDEKHRYTGMLSGGGLRSCGNFRGPCTARSQKVQEFNSFTQPSLHHLRTEQHLGDDFRDLPGSEVEPTVEHFHALEDVLAGQVRVTQGSHLYAAAVHEL